jgi:hypothetical protein
LGCPTPRPQPIATTLESSEGTAVRFPLALAASVFTPRLDSTHGAEAETRCCREGDCKDVHVRPEPNRQDRRGLIGEEPHGRGRPSPWPGNCTVAAGQRSRHLPRSAVRGASFPPCTPPSSRFSGTSTSTCTNSLQMPSYVCRCTRGYVGLRRSSLLPKGSLRRIRYTTSGGQSSKKRGTNLWRRTASSVV